MLRHFTLEYSVDEEWHIGRLKENPGVLSQDESLQELEENIKDAYKLMMQEDEEEYCHSGIKRKEVGIEV